MALLDQLLAQNPQLIQMLLGQQGLGGLGGAQGGGVPGMGLPLGGAPAGGGGLGGLLGQLIGQGNAGAPPGLQGLPAQASPRAFQATGQQQIGLPEVPLPPVPPPAALPAPPPQLSTPIQPGGTPALSGGGFGDLGSLIGGGATLLSDPTAPRVAGSKGTLSDPRGAKGTGGTLPGGGTILHNFQATQGR
jgi:hypothetical protein